MPDTSDIFAAVVVDGTRQPLTDTHIPLFHQGYYACYGVYESVKVDRGRPFYLTEHLHRLHNSAGMLGLTLDTSIETLTAWFELLRELDPHASWSLRIVAIGALGDDPGPVIAFRAVPLPAYPQALYDYGATAVLYEGQRHLPACKSLNLLVNHLARETAVKAHALEGILHYNGLLTEGSRTNVFGVCKGQLLTAPVETVLSGITREVLLEVMQDTDYPIQEAPMPADPSAYEELFISSTSMHVMPVTKVDGAYIGDGRVGPITRLAMTQFDDYYTRVMG